MQSHAGDLPAGHRQLESSRAIRTKSIRLGTLSYQVEQMRLAGGGLVLLHPARDNDAAIVADGVGVAYLNLSHELSKSLLDIPVPNRALRAPRLAAAIFSRYPDGVAVGRLGLLHLPSLQLDPLGILRSAARTQVVVAEWEGSYDGATLTYAEPGHLEYRRWTDPTVPVLHIERTME